MTAVPIHVARRRTAAYAAVAVIAVPLVAIATAAMTEPGASYTIDVGTPAAAPLTGGGFGQDAVSMEGARSFVWVEGTAARVRLPRAAWTGATVRVALLGRDEPVDGLRQRVTASVNEVGVWRHDPPAGMAGDFVCRQSSPVDLWFQRPESVTLPMPCLGPADGN